MSTQTPYEKAVDVIAGGLRSSYIHWNDLHESRRQVYRRRARRLLAKADNLLREHYEQGAAESAEARIAARVIHLLAFEPEPYTMAQLGRALAVATAGGTDAEYLAASSTQEKP